MTESKFPHTPCSANTTLLPSQHTVSTQTSLTQNAEVMELLPPFSQTPKILHYFYKQGSIQNKSSVAEKDEGSRDSHTLQGLALAGPPTLQPHPGLALLPPHRRRLQPPDLHTSCFLIRSVLSSDTNMAHPLSLEISAQLCFIS